MIPDFQNPSGESLTLEERQMLVALAQKYDFFIVEDSPYRELRYEGEHIPSLYSLDPDRVIYLGSFSKIFAPGFRNWRPDKPDIQSVPRPSRCRPSELPAYTTRPHRL